MNFVCNLVLSFLFSISFLSLNSVENFETCFLEKNIHLMNAKPSKEKGMDIVIISASTPELTQFWENRLKQTRSCLMSDTCILICVDEDWHGEGAGNGLGSLYAFKKAYLKAKEEWGIDLIKEQLSGAAIALYHTAGQGKRLAPLTISEDGIKSAVRLPGLLSPIENAQDESLLFTLLEATIKQSMIFAPSRKGRLSVFWSDQVFIPSKSCDYAPTSHIDILVKQIPFPTQQEWKEQNLDNYGLIAWDKKGNAKLFDKCNYATFGEILNADKAISQRGVGISMGAFSLSTEMTIALLDEFEEEMKDKNLLLDSDPYFWMPLTLDFESYHEAMSARKASPDFICPHYERMKKFKEKFNASLEFSPFILFEAVNIGKESYWWDYGTLDSYYKNNKLLIQSTKEGELMRKFYLLDKHFEKTKSHSSIVVGSQFNAQKIRNSIILNSKADTIDCNECIFIDCHCHQIQGIHGLGYAVCDESLKIGKNCVRADLHLPTSSFFLKLHTHLNDDGKANWQNKLPGNTHSWEEFAHLIISSKKHQF